MRNSKILSITLLIGMFVPTYIYAADFEIITGTYYMIKEDFISKTNGVQATFKVKKRPQMTIDRWVIMEYVVKWADKEKDNKIIKEYIYAIDFPEDTLVKSAEPGNPYQFSRIYRLDSFWFSYPILPEHPMTYGGGLVGGLVGNAIKKGKGSQIILTMIDERKNFIISKNSLKKYIKKLNDSDAMYKLSIASDSHEGLFQLIKEYNLFPQIYMDYNEFVIK